MTTWIEACATDAVNKEELIRFDYTTGHAKVAPCIINLKTYEVKVESGKVLINLA